MKKNLNTFTQTILERQLAAVKEKLPDVEVKFPNPENFMEFHVIFQVSQGIWKGGTFVVQFNICQNWPNDRPIVRLLTKVWHPNIVESGFLNLKILKEYMPSVSISQIIIAIQNLFYEPNWNCDLNQQAVQQYHQSYSDFCQKAQDYIRENQMNDLENSFSSKNDKNHLNNDQQTNSDNNSNNSDNNSNNSDNHSNDSDNHSNTVIQQKLEDINDFNSKTIGFIGVGEMASAIIEGLQKSTITNRIIGSVRTQKSAEIVQNRFHINITTNNLIIAQESDIIILCVKPNLIPIVISEINSYISTKPIISIAGGVTLKTLQSCNKLAHFIRVMPNICAAVQESATTYSINSKSNTNQNDVDFAKYIFEKVGSFIEIDEELMDTASAVAGCSPAFIFPLIEAMADGAVFEGMPRSLALKLAAQAVVGAGKLVLVSGKHPEALKDSVCSPGGSTIAGVKALEDGNVRAGLFNAVIASTEKSKGNN